MNWTVLLMFLQVFFSIVIGLYFWNLLRNQQTNRSAVDKESRKELEKLNRMRRISLTEPLAEKTRPSKLEDIVGQEEGIRALKAALCGPNPQHVIIYGPPGVGKTAAARVVLEEAKKSGKSPFNQHSRFIEIDATTARFDERGIADPLIGSVHDPIYQGAGAMGMAGIPQPKPGAVTKAHGGILFIDEIGELHPIQMNKLLKVLEDRKVFLESAYYSSEDTNTPSHIHDIFQNGLPADFRLIGATTRTSEDIPPAIRSRCMEIFFRPLLTNEIEKIAVQALERIKFGYHPEAVAVIQKYATNGRDAVNIVQTAVGLAMTEGRNIIEAADVEWVVHSSQLPPRPEKKMPSIPQVGLAMGLAVYGPNLGMVLEIEVSATPASPGKGTIQITGVVEEEEMGGRQRTLRRKSMARGSVENVITVLRKTDVQPDDYHLHINFPGGIPLDGPSAGITMATAIYSAIKGIPVDHLLAMTGELSIHGHVKPVGGVIAKVEAAKHAGATRVIIPAENMQSIFKQIEGVEIIPVDRIETVLKLAFEPTEEPKEAVSATPAVWSPTSAPI
ncbi:ATP-dependent protease LonB [Paenactinomyces guangxiensis]|uniref:endopeptidase La n=1 Tax=Paenactinomyces guangxiensis TaxID=1490290 RepID=A0A7W1WUG7_9BACL|nr:ATP-dependent protease LonB [Paenactinomyces guangxiensis]MBA4496284.1 ATP-dependent protease LonB [Paenactinomyces guangxiensis]MBH8593337.1 ATP-dependent protease LonB [Paenactinomyces guangxiensis]